MMLKSVMAGAAALALMTGVAFAQDTTSTQEKTTVQNPNGSQSMKAEKTESSTDGMGNDTVQTKKVAHSTDSMGNDVKTHRSSTQTHNADGSVSSSSEERTNSGAAVPAMPQDSTSTTSTTTSLF
jgi:hypothetical protein